MFLFDLYLLFSKEVKDTNGVVKYVYKNKLMTSDLGVTEHIEGGDECKFAIWTGRAPMISDFRIVLKANSLETKQTWIKRLREVIQETYFSGTSFSLLKSPGKVTNNKNNLSASQRLSKDIEEQGIPEHDPDGSSLQSFGSGNTTDSEKVSQACLFIMNDEICRASLHRQMCLAERKIPIKNVSVRIINKRKSFSREIYDFNRDVSCFPFVERRKYEKILK